MKRVFLAEQSIIDCMNAKLRVGVGARAVAAHCKNVWARAVAAHCKNCMDNVKPWLA